MGKKNRAGTRSLFGSVPNMELKPLHAAQIQGAVRVICLAGPAGPGARARQAIFPWGGLLFAARSEVG